MFSNVIVDMNSKDYWDMVKRLSSHVHEETGGQGIRVVDLTKTELIKQGKDTFLYFLKINRSTPQTRTGKLDGVLQLNRFNMKKT